MTAQIFTFADLKNWRKASKTVDPPVRIGVFGDPVEHSLSPEMHNAALRECKIEMQYGAFHIRPDELAEALELIRANDFIGVNLTVPHKVATLEHLDDVDGTARKIGAVNLIKIEGCSHRPVAGHETAQATAHSAVATGARERKLIGFNTDGSGFARAIRHEFSVDLRDLRVLLLGAGGAGRAIAYQCAIENSERLVIVNRTVEKAQKLTQELAKHFAGPRVLGPVARLQALPWDDASLRFQIENSDLIVNATPLGLKHVDPPVLSRNLLAPHLMIYDTVYGSSRTPLLISADAVGARGANGLSMLLYQGAESFEHWFDRPAPLEAMRKALAL